MERARKKKGFSASPLPPPPPPNVVDLGQWPIWPTGKSGAAWTTALVT